MRNEITNEMLEKVKHEIELNSDYVCEMTTVNKVNENLTGLCLKKPNSFYGVNIYASQLEAMMNEGLGSEQIAYNCVRIAENNELQIESPKPLSDIVTNWDEAKKYVLPKVINTERNTAYLADKISRKMLNLSICYYIQLPGEILPPNNEDAIPTVTVTKEIFEKWGTTMEDVNYAALGNLDDGEIVDVVTVLKRMLGELDDIPGMSDIGNDEPGLFVLKGKNNESYGAACILHQHILDEFYNEHGSFYILPSSVHELLLRPAKDEMHLKDLVMSVNSDVLAANDFLSDNVYLYDGKEIRIAE